MALASPPLVSSAALSRIFIGTRREVFAVWRFTARDLPAALLPGVGFGAASWSAQEHREDTLPVTLLACLAYFSLYIYMFCLANQVTGEDEDRENKPSRPLITGFVTRDWAYRRFQVLVLVFPLVGWALGVLLWALMWEVLVLVYNFLGWDRHWLTKNLFIVLGAVALLSAAWQISGPLTAVAWRWILTLSLTTFVLITAQDMRDTRGDHAVGRRTLPIVLGLPATRWMLSMSFAVLPILVHFVLLTPTGNGLAGPVLDAVQAGVSLAVAVRLLVFRSVSSDHLSYMLYSWWFTLMTIGAAFVLHA